MKKLVVLAALMIPTWAAETADLAQIHSIYILPMANGLDQYLANRISGEQLFQIVTEPKRAEAVFTDQIGQAFEQRILELYPPEEPAPTAKDDEQTGKIFGDTTKMRSPGFSRGKGNLFLVDLKTRRVLWSTYERPKNSTPDQLNRTSGRVVEELRKTIKGK